MLVSYIYIELYTVNFFFRSLGAPKKRINFPSNFMPQIARTISPLSSFTGGEKKEGKEKKSAIFIARERKNERKGKLHFFPGNANIFFHI